MITAVVGLVTAGAGFAGGFFTQSQVGEARPQPTVTVTVPGPTVTVTTPASPAAATAATAPASGASVKALPSGAAPSPSATGRPLLSASPDAGKGGTKVLVAGTGFPPGDAVRVSFVVKDSTIGDLEIRDLRDTMSGSDGAFSVEVLIPSDLSSFATYNTYLRVKGATGQSETVFDLTR
ncbi:hypothetical protein ACIRBX_22225 [Kitasatospora sp. NPDC096147]|uniref:hypothetical protein n=1 Tax=Kitasatospora sp. NPDC096147 TaxID=3364093 RepID=UPI0037FAABDB